MTRTRTYSWPDPAPITSAVRELSGPEIVKARRLHHDHRGHVDVLERMPAGVGYTTIDLQMRFFKPVLLETGPIIVESTAEHVGRRVGAATCRVLSAGGVLHAIGSTSRAMLAAKR